MARCNSCLKFCPVELAEPETYDLECDGKSVGGTIRLSLTSGCCGDEVAEATVEVEMDLPDHECAPGFEVDPETWEGWEAEFEAEASDWYEGRKGAPMRYQKHFYGAEVTATLTCPVCGEGAEATCRVGEQASYFEAV